MSLSVIIPSKTAVNLKACIDGMRAAAEISKVIVVDDFAVRAPELPSDCGWVTWIKGIRPFVFARNINIGICEAGTDDVILLNDDALLMTEGGFSTMQASARAHPEFGIISATTNISNSPTQRPRGIGLRESPARGLPFVCVLIPRRTIEAVGLLDERFAGEVDGEMVYGGEDDDYCYRVRIAGLKLGVHDGCFVDHASLKSTFRPRGGGLPINATRKRFRQIHGFEMGTR